MREVLEPSESESRAPTFSLSMNLWNLMSCIGAIWQRQVTAHGSCSSLLVKKFSSAHMGEALTWETAATTATSTVSSSRCYHVLEYLGHGDPWLGNGYTKTPKSRLQCGY